MNPTSSNSISGSTKLSRAAAILQVELDSDLLLMDIDQGKYFDLKGPARHIWEAVNPSSHFDEVCSRLREQYRAPPGRIESDLILFIGELVKHKLLVLA